MFYKLSHRVCCDRLMLRWHHLYSAFSFCSNKIIEKSVCVRTLIQWFLFKCLNLCFSFFFYQISLNSSLLRGTLMINPSFSVANLCCSVGRWMSRLSSFFHQIHPLFSFLLLVRCIQPRVVLSSVWLCWGCTPSLLHPSLLLRCLQNSAIKLSSVFSPSQTVSSTKECVLAFVQRLISFILCPFNR